MAKAMVTSDVVYKVLRGLIEGLPPDAVALTLALRVGEPARITVEAFVRDRKTKRITPKLRTARFGLTAWRARTRPAGA